MAIGASQLLAQDVPMTFAKYLTDWMSDSTTVNILVTGYAGTGKSSLVNSVLGISKVTEQHTLLQGKATALKRWQNKIGNIQVRMWDSPGLGQPPTDKDKAKAVEDIKKNCRDIDLCFFCVDMTNLRFPPEYGEAMKDLSEILGRDVWKHTLFVLTFANKFLIRIEEDYLNNLEGKKQKFEHQIELWKEKLHLHLEKQVKLPPLIAKNTKAVPVGDQRSDQLFPDDNKRWSSELWLQAISAVQHTAKQAVLKISQYLVRKTESDPLHQLSVKFSLLMQENFEISPEKQETDDADKPQGQSLVNF